MEAREGMYVRLLYILNSQGFVALPTTLFPLFPETLWTKRELEEILGIEKEEYEEGFVAEKKEVVADTKMNLHKWMKLYENL